MTTLVKAFEAHCLIKAHDENAEGERFIYAPIHQADEPDLQGDILTKGGLIEGLATHQDMGAHVDYAHEYIKTKNPKWLIGNGLPDAPEIDGIPNMVTRLLKGKEWADEVWTHLLTKGIMGYSLQGVALACDPQNAKRITRLAIKLVTVDPAPISRAVTRLKMGNPVLHGLGALTKAFGDQLTSGDLDGWSALDESEVSLPVEDTAAFGWSMAALQKAITVGSGPAGPDSTGGTAVLRETLSARQEAKAQRRCPACGTKNRDSRTKCRSCRCSLG